MGITYVQVQVSNPRQPGERAVELDCLVDTGAIYSVVPHELLEALGIAPLRREQFMLADGTHQTWDVGEAFFELAGRAGTSNVVFGPRDVLPLVGAFTLEGLGLMISPVTRELRPMRLVLARVTRGVAA